MMDATEQRDDAELVVAVLAGDRKAFGPLLACWRPSLLGLCRRALGPGPQAEDLAHEGGALVVHAATDAGLLGRYAAEGNGGHRADGAVPDRPRPRGG